MLPSGKKIPLVVSVASQLRRNLRRGRKGVRIYQFICHAMLTAVADLEFKLADQKQVREPIGIIIA